jgi:HlyD family secretion protein
MKLRRVLWISVLLVGGGAGAWWALQPRPVPVDLVTVEVGTLVVSVDDEGIAKIRDTYTVTTPIGGEVERIPYKVGDAILAGQVVVSIMPSRSGFLDERSLAEAEAAVRAAEAMVRSADTEVAGADAALTYWQSEATRNTQLLDRGLRTEQAAEQVALELARRKVQVDNARAVRDLRQRQLEQARARLLEPVATMRRDLRLAVKAPVSGQVLELSSEGARALQAGAPLLVIGDPENLEIEVDLLSSDAVRIANGAPATIERWGGDAILEARVQRIEPIGFTKVSALGVEEQRVRVHLEILSPAKERAGLGHRYRVFVRIEAQRVENVPLVPNAALFRDGPDWAVFEAIAGKVEQTKVSLGARDSALSVITGGLEAGARVIVHPNDQIGPGTLITDRGELPAS